MTSIRLPATHAAGLVAAVGAGVGAGALTAYLQGVLSADWSTVSNSGAVWTAVAFVAVAALARSRAVAALAGLLVLTGEVAGYYLYLADVRHVAGGHAAEVLWTVAALWLGPVTGIAAFHARWGSPAQRMRSCAALGGVVTGEGSYLVHVAGVPRAGWVEIVLGVTLAVVAIAVGRVPVPTRGGALAVAGGVAAAIYLAYRLLAFGGRAPDRRAATPEGHEQWAYDVRQPRQGGPCVPGSMVGHLRIGQGSASIRLMMRA